MGKGPVMTDGSSTTAPWYGLLAKELRASRFSFRPNDHNGFFFGFLFRLVAAIVAVVWSTVAIFLIVGVSLLFAAPNGWHLSDWLLVLYGTLISLTIFAGEHLRSRVYERVIRDWPGDEAVTVQEYAAIARDLEANQPIDRHAPKALAAKRAFDLLFSTLLLLLLLPVFFLLSLLIKFDSRGPILFAQKRVGPNGRVISLLKFRTMHYPEVMSDSSHALRNDPRVTRVGRYLRLTSLDELPQLFNVFKGDMSLVGPRPQAITGSAKFENLARQGTQFDWVKPGITGWAQVNGFRGAASNADLMRRRFEYERWYIEHWSLLLDLRILFRTIILGFLARDKI
jgi:lipopolysaccharide/colanic/teichoic acid biosynthesis glycosyltransferase